MRLTWLLLFIPFIAAAQPECTLELEKDSIKVYTCARSDSKYKSVKAVFTVNSTLTQLAAALLDVDGYKAWQYKTESARILKRISDGELIYYTEVSAPVLTSNRDFIIRLTIDPDPMTKGMIIEAVSLPDYLPTVENVIRVPYSRALWKVAPAGRGKLSVEYSIDIDLGGSVPPWMVNLVAPKAPYETFKALREKIGSYSGKNVQFIKD